MAAWGVRTAAWCFVKRLTGQLWAAEVGEERRATAKSVQTEKYPWVSGSCRASLCTWSLHRGQGGQGRKGTGQGACFCGLSQPPLFTQGGPYLVPSDRPAPLSLSLPLSPSLVLSLSLALPPPPPHLYLCLFLLLSLSPTPPVCLSVSPPTPHPHPFLSTTYSIHLPHYLLPSLPTFTILLPLHSVLVLFPPPPTPTPSSSLPPSPFSFTLLTYHHQQIPTPFTFHVRHHFLSLCTSVCFPPPHPPPPHPFFLKPLKGAKMLHV